MTELYELYGRYPELPNLVMLITAVLVAVACALPGTFLVLRRMGLISDAISHAMLPGIAIGFMLTHSLDPFVMVIGAGAASLVTVWLVETLFRSRRLHEDTAIAIVFSAMFALGVVLIARYRYVHIDAECIVLGAIEHTPLQPFDTALFGTLLPGPRSLWVLGAVALLNLAFVLLFYKELKLCTFDPALAQSLGYSPTRMHYLLMTLVSITTVAAFEAVGAVLVVAFLIVPPAAAYLLTDRLWLMLVLSVGLGVLAAAGGFSVAQKDVLNCSISGAMASMAGVLFLFIWLAAPRHGLLATLFRRLRLRRRFAGDLLLIHLKKTGTIEEAEALSEERFHWARRYGRTILLELQSRGLIKSEAGRISLTPEGEIAVEALAKA